MVRLSETYFILRMTQPISLEIFFRDSPIVVRLSIEKEETNQCSVCLSNFADDDSPSSTELRKMPNCRHYFHSTCLSEWLTKHNSNCPVCRSPVVCLSLPKDEPVVIPSDLRSGQLFRLAQLERSLLVALMLRADTPRVYWN